MAVVLVVGTVALTPVFGALGSYEPVWADAWTFVGSLLATYGMAKGLVEFWLDLGACRRGRRAPAFQRRILRKRLHVPVLRLLHPRRLLYLVEGPKRLEANH